MKADPSGGTCPLPYFTAIIRYHRCQRLLACGSAPRRPRAYVAFTAPCGPSAKKARAFNSQGADCELSSGSQLRILPRERMPCDCQRLHVQCRCLWRPWQPSQPYLLCDGPGSFFRQTGAPRRPPWCGASRRTPSARRLRPPSRRRCSLQRSQTKRSRKLQSPRLRNLRKPHQRRQSLRQQSPRCVKPRESPLARKPTRESKPPRDLRWRLLHRARSTLNPQTFLAISVPRSPRPPHRPPRSKVSPRTAGCQRRRRSFEACDLCHRGRSTHLTSSRRHLTELGVQCACFDAWKGGDSFLSRGWQRRSTTLLALPGSSCLTDILSRLIAYAEGEAA